jgi:hypothetical protein
MRQVQLVFSNAADAWNFITASRVTNVAVTHTTITGFLKETEIELAIKDFGADVKDYAPEEVPESETTYTQDHTEEATAAGQPIELLGKSGAAYNGTIYAKNDSTVSMPAHAIIGLANSALFNGLWQHAVNAFYRTDNVQQEMDNFRSREDLSHMIVIPVNPAEHSQIDKVDDLIRSYIHQ